MAIKPIAQPSAPRQRKIFLHRESIDVAHAAPRQIAGRRMMHRMGMAPEIVRREGQDADDPPDPVIERAAAEERAVPAIMLDHEQADQERGGRNDEQKAEPIAEM